MQASVIENTMGVGDVSFAKINLGTWIATSLYALGPSFCNKQGFTISIGHPTSAELQWDPDAVCDELGKAR